MVFLGNYMRYLCRKISNTFVRTGCQTASLLLHPVKSYEKLVLQFQY